MRLTGLVLVAVMVGAASCRGDESVVIEPSAPPTSIPTVAPTTTTAVPIPELDELTAADRREILAAAVVHRVTVANSWGGADVFDRVEITDRLGTNDESGYLIDDEHAAIVVALAPREVVVVAPLSIGSPQEADLLAERDAALVELSVPVLADGEVQITTSLVCGELCGIGGMNLVERGADGTWSIGRPVTEWVA